MRKFFFNISVFILGFTALAVLIGSIPIPDTYISYKTIGTHYEKIAWNLNQINNHPERIKGSLVFVGPSLTQGGISDSILHINGINSINLGVNHSGNEIELYFLNKVLKYKPKKVYLNLSKDKVKNLHSMTPLLYSPLSLISAGQSINITFMNFVFRRAGFVLDYFVWNMVHEKKEDKIHLPYGVVYQEGEYSSVQYNGINKDQMDYALQCYAIEMNNFKFKSEKNRRGLFFEIIRLRRRLLALIWNSDFIYNVVSQQDFVMNAFENASRNNVDITELYIPAIMDAKVGLKFSPLLYSPRQTINVESLKDFSCLDSASYWVDMNHLSMKGSLLFTQELVVQGVIKP